MIDECGIKFVRLSEAKNEEPFRFRSKKEMPQKSNSEEFKNAKR